ncbi:pilus assembly protein PapC [Vibrio mytili]|uniref:pilus assembly protein PapC n=1 Tax=Vibrio mytili TaxID=50718 RepID=UPI0039EAE0DA
MKKTISGLLLLFIFSFAYAQDWVFPLPATWGDRELGELDSRTDGQIVNSVNTAQLKTLTKQLVNPQTYTKLEQYSNSFISTKELEQMGILINFDAGTQTVDFTFSESAAANFLLSFGSEYKPAQYSESAFWTWKNTFNASTDYTFNQASGLDNTQTWLGEWLINMNIGGVRGANLDVSGFIDGGTNIDAEFYRGEAKLFFDEPDSPWRFTLGDVSLNGAGHLPSAPIGGLAFERLYQDLQPTRNIQNGGTQPLILNESADVEIYINDIFFTEIRLPPGRYTLDDLPLISGTNDVRLDISYQSGRRDTIVYSQFFNSRLLREGISDFGFYSGLYSSIVDNDFEYDQDQWITSGYYDYGINDYLTVGINGLYHPEGQQLGFIATIGTEYGNIGLRLSGQQNKPNDLSGGIISLDYAHQIWGTDDYGSPNFRLGAEYQQQYFSLPWQEELPVTGYLVFSNYVFTITDTLSTVISGDYRDYDEQEIEWLASAQLTWQWNSLSISAGVEQEDNPNENIDETRFTFSSDWNWYSENGDYGANVSYSNLPDSYRAQFQRPSDNYTGSHGYALSLEGDSSSQVYSAEANYVANRFLIDGEVSHYQFDETDGYHTASLRTSTALSMADGHIAWSRPINGPIAIINVHNSLDADVDVNAFADDPPELISTSSISNAASLPGGHQQSNIYITSPDAPIGYNLGDYERTITPGTQTGHVIQVGSDASKTIIGTIEIANNSPLSLHQGLFTGQSKTYEFFTNRAGKFVVEGVAPGTYSITIPGFSSLEVQVPDVSENLIYLPTLQIKEG